MIPVRTLFILVLLAALAIWTTGCTSPLDADAPRKVTPVTPAAKVTPISVSAEFTNARSSYRIKGLPIFKVDTTTSPATVWMDVTMEQQNAPDNKPLIESFRIQADSVPGEGYQKNLQGNEMSLLLNLKSGPFTTNATPSNAGWVLVSEPQRKPGEPRRITISVYVLANKDSFWPDEKQEQVFGLFELVL